MKIIICTATHGDEKIGFKVINQIRKLDLIKGEIMYLTANEKAAKLNKRFIESDLNRSFPGNAKGTYEERLALNILPLIKSADIVIDIHSTTSELKDALIVTKLNRKLYKYIKVIAPKYLLYMKATGNSALISHAKLGIAFEYGKDTSKATIDKVTLGIKRLLSHLGIIKNKIATNHSYRPESFEVYTSVPKPTQASLLPKIRNYKLIRKGEAYAISEGKNLVAKKDFYPILFGQDNYESIFGFAARKVNITKLNN